MKELLKPFGFNESDKPVHVTLAGMTYPDQSYSIRRKNSDVSVIEYVTEGSGYVLIDGKEHFVTKDTVYFLTQGDDHIYRASPDEPYSKIFLNVTGSMSVRMAEEFGLSGKKFFSGEGLLGLFRKIMDVISSDISDNEMQSALRGIYIEILSRLSYAQREKVLSREGVELKGYIDSNPDRIITSKELSKIIFRSPDYCLKLFKREFGITPYAYQLERKMEMAKILLADTNKSVGETARSLGYTDMHYFSNLFTDKCGMRPLEYRKMKRK